VRIVGSRENATRAARRLEAVGPTVELEGLAAADRDGRGEDRVPPLHEPQPTLLEGNEDPTVRIGARHARPGTLEGLGLGAHENESDRRQYGHAEDRLSPVGTLYLHCLAPAGSLLGVRTRVLHGAGQAWA
jgi:hypothetical protein